MKDQPCPDDGFPKAVRQPSPAPSRLSVHAGAYSDAPSRHPEHQHADQPVWEDIAKLQKKRHLPASENSLADLPNPARSDQNVTSAHPEQKPKSERSMETESVQSMPDRNWSSWIHPGRRPQPVPNALVSPDGSCVFGTFDGEFASMDLLHARNATHLPDLLNRWKLTLWQATEVHLKEGVLLAVVCDMGIFGKTLNVFYDKRNHKVYTFDTNLPSSKTTIAPSLMHGSISQAKTSNSEVHYTNLFERGLCHLQGHHQNKEHSISYDFHLKRLSKPSVVSIPFGPNRPLYSQKDFLKAEGMLTIDSETLTSDENSVAVMDDHRGFYPRHTHYDWVTTLGTMDDPEALSDEKQAEKHSPAYFAFNLTRNQSIDQERFNENLIWLSEDTSLLPPVTFSRNPQSKDFSDYALWTIKDEHDMVSIKFHVHAMSPMVVHAGVVNIDYYIAFGELEGYVRKEDGTKIILDGMMGMGEDKTLLL